jgi:hypothetical protein
LNTNVNASSRRSVPSQVNLHRRQSIVGWKWAAKRSRTRLLTLRRALLQDAQEIAARDAREAVARGADPLSPEEDVDVGPVREAAGDRSVRLGIGLLEVAEGLVGEHDAPAERVVGPVALAHGDLVRRVQPLHQDREVEPGRPPADDLDPQRVLMRPALLTGRASGG